MALKAKINEETFGKLPDHFKAEYVEKEEGGKKFYFLAVEGVDGLVLDNPSKLQKALEAERENARKAATALKDFEGLDAAAAREAIAKLKDAPTDEKVEARIASAVKRAEETWSEKLKASDAKGQGYRSALERELVDGRIASAISKHGGRLSLLGPAVRSHVEMVEDAKGAISIKVKGPDGQPLYSQSHGKSHEPMGLEEFVGTLKNHEDFAPAFAASGASGGGTKPDAAPRAGGSFTISSADATDPAKYRAVRSAAEKAGQAIQIV